MRQSVLELCDLLISNRDAIGKSFFAEFGIMEVGASMVFSKAGQKADPDRINMCKKILSKNASAFSALRCIGRPLVISKMAVSEDPKKYLEDLKSVYNTLKKGRGFETDYVVLAAANLCESGRLNEAPFLIDRFNEIEKKMNKNHPILTNGGDFSIIMMLALSNKPVDAIIDGIEECYRYMRTTGVRVTKDGLHGLSQVLTLMGGDMKENCEKAVRLYKKFREHSTRYGKDSQFQALGTLVDIDEDADVLVNEIVETADYLKKHKGFGCMNLDKSNRLMFATMVVASAYEKEGRVNGSMTIVDKTVLTNTLTIAISLEIAIYTMIMIAACSSN